jgi:hypothetical protein
MKHGGKWNEDWNKKIEDLGLKSSAKIQKGDPFRGVLKCGSTSRGRDAEQLRASRSDRFGATEEEWDICEQMVSWRRAGWTYGKIANHLNQMNIKTKAGNDWNYFTARFVTLRSFRLQDE